MDSRKCRLRPDKSFRQSLQFSPSIERHGGFPARAQCCNRAVSLFCVLGPPLYILLPFNQIDYPRIASRLSAALLTFDI